MTLSVLLASVVFGLQVAPPKAPVQAGPGDLTIFRPDGKVAGLCPLKGTKVNTSINGFGVRVTLVQTFVNPSKEPVEAIYTFPLSENSAVDRMKIKVGNRIINGEIKERGEARAIYEAAKAQGKVASLLDQERPNIFTQSLANLMPGATIEVEISYVELAKYEEGWFEFSYPMVVGPRFLDGETPDASKINPDYAPKATRTGTTIDVTVDIDAGAPIVDVKSELHAIKTERPSENQARVTLSKRDEIPNKDFVLRWRVPNEQMQGAFLTHVSTKGEGFFSLILLPPKDPGPRDIAPKELILVMDQSGSQNGFPIEKSKELAKLLLSKLRPDDTVNVVSFANSVTRLWATPVNATPEAIAEATNFVSTLKANGGTQLKLAVDAALQPPADPNRVRIVAFCTDGYVGDDYGVLDAVKSQRDKAHMFTFGIGNSVNRFLIAGMSAEGKGDAEFVTLASDADAAAARFERRVRTPVLTDVQVEISGVPVDGVTPTALPDVFSEKPVVLMGRYHGPGQGTITLTGKIGSRSYRRVWNVEFPAVDKDGDSIASLWARAQIGDLMRENWLANKGGNGDEAKLKALILPIALKYKLMSQYTSFVAVEQKVVNVGGKTKTINVPVDMADGVDLEGGDKSGLRRGAQGGGFGSGGFGGGGGSVAAPGSPATLGPPAAKEASKMNDAGRPRNDPSLTPAQIAEMRYTSIVEEALRKITSGKVEIQINLKEWKASDIEKLKNLGFKIDDKDQGLKMLFGSCDVKTLKALAQVGSVTRIRRLNI